MEKHTAARPVPATVSCMRTFDPWEVRDPAAMLQDMVARCRPVAGDVLVALLDRGDAPGQSVIDVVRLHHGATPARSDGSALARDRACRLVDRRAWTGDRWAAPQFVLFTIVCRTGRVVPGPDELFWLDAWLFSNHHRNAFDGDVYLLTDHGWTGCADRRAGFAPSLGAASRHLSLLTSTADARTPKEGRRRQP